MTNPRFDVLCIGNAIVDVIADADDAFLSRQGLDKGSMRLIDEEEPAPRSVPGHSIRDGERPLRRMSGAKERTDGS